MLNAPAVPEKLAVFSETEDKGGLGDPRKGNSGNYLQKQRRETPELDCSLPFPKADRVCE